MGGKAKTEKMSVTLPKKLAGEIRTRIPGRNQLFFYRSTRALSGVPQTDDSFGERLRCLER